MPLVVQKFGGSSLATPAHIRRAAARIQECRAQGNDVVIVVSAMGHMTDHLIRVAGRVVASPPQRELDMLLSAGERISMALVAMALQAQGVPAISFTGSQSGIVTSSDHTNARIIDIRATRIREELAKGKVVIVAGFQGVSLEKEITTLGRGGSDTTAIALAAVLGADRCEILTDVDGLFTADPRLVSSAKLIEECSYDEGLELASLGAKMHARSLSVAKRYAVKVWIASSANLSSRGTWIRNHFEPSQLGELMERTVVRGIATRDGYHFFRAHAEMSGLLSVVKPLKLTLRFFHYAKGTVDFLCEQEFAEGVKAALKGKGIEFEDLAKVAIVSAVGDAVGTSSDLLPEFLETLEECQAPCLILTSNALSVTAAISSAHKTEVAKLLHQKWVEADKKKEPPQEGALSVGSEPLLIQ